MFHYVDFGEENRSKKRIVKNLKTASQTDRGVGLTTPQAFSVETLLKSCEDIETQATIVLKSLDQSILKNTYFAQEGIHRLYVVIRQGIKALTSTTFRNLPKTDVQNLTDYKKSLEDLYNALEERFAEVNERIFGNEPLKGRTYAQYKRDTGKEYRPPIPAQKLSKYLQEKNLREFEIKKQSKILQQENDRLQREYYGIDGRLQEISDRVEALDADIRYKNDTFMRQRDAIESGTLASKELKQMTRQQEGLARALNKLQDERYELMREYEELQMSKQSLPLRIQQIEKDMRKLPQLPEDFEPTEPLTPEEYSTQLSLEEKAQIGEKDFELIMKEFKIFINSLGDGLVRFVSGLSSKLSKSQETNFRTPIDIAISKLEGSGGFRGHSGYEHKRFL